MIAAPAGWIIVGLAAVPSPPQESPGVEPPVLRVHVEPTAIEFGGPYLLTIEREWPRDWQAEEWNASALAHLRIELVEHESTRARDRRVERWTYRGRAYELDELVIPSLGLSAAPPGGSALVTRSAEARTPVIPGVDHEEPGPPELPREPFEPPRDRGPWIATGVVLSVAGALWCLWRTRRRERESSVPEGAVEPGAVARLEQIDEAFGRDPDPLRLIEELSSLVRETLERVQSIRAPRMTTEQFLAAHETIPGLSEEGRVWLADFLRRCDRVKFAHAAIAVEEGREILVAAGRFLVEIDPGMPVESSP